MLYCKTCQVVYFRYPMEKFEEKRHYVEVVVEYNDNMELAHEKTEKKLTVDDGYTTLDNPMCPVELRAKVKKGIQLRNGYYGLEKDLKVPRHAIQHHIAESRYYAELLPYMKQNKLQLKKLSPTKLLEVSDILSRALNS